MQRLRRRNLTWTSSWAILEEYHCAEAPTAGSFALGRRWPKAQGLDEVLGDAAAVSHIEKVQVTLAQSIAAMEADEEEALRAEKEAVGKQEGGRRSPKAKKPAKEAAAGAKERKGGAKGAAGPAKGVKKPRVSEAAAARRRMGEANRR